MKTALTPEQAAHLVMQMRVSNLLGSRPDILKENKELRETYALYRENLEKIMALLSDEDKDALLERYRIEAEKLAAEKGTEAGN